MKAPDDPPSLEHIGRQDHTRVDLRLLKDPQAYAATATMPNFKLSDNDARDVSAFLIANSTPQPGDTATLSAKASSDPAAGATLYGESFLRLMPRGAKCSGQSGRRRRGPELTRVGKQGKTGWLPVVVAQSARL